MIFTINRDYTQPLTALTGWFCNGKTVWHGMIGYLVNHELQRMARKATIAQFEILSLKEGE
jgi:hypothetical protein